jgi:hypothetical protein
MQDGKLNIAIVGLGFGPEYIPSISTTPTPTCMRSASMLA